MLMTILENANTVISLICGVLSVIMFILTKKKKDECVRISNTIDQKIQIFNKNASIQSNDEFKISSVGTLDNRKSIKQED